MSRPPLQARTTRRAVLLWGGAAMLAGCGAGLHGMRRRVGFAVVNQRLLLHGTITPRTFVEWSGVLEQNPQITTVGLQDLQGAHDPQTAAALGRDLRARGLATALQSDSDITGAAVLVFMAGAARRMVSGARIGLSGTQDWPASYVAQMLGSADFHRFALRLAPADGIHNLTPQEIAQFGLLTEPVVEWT